MTEDSKFCTGCGRGLEPGMQFCPQCGRVVSGSETEEEYRQKAVEVEQFLAESRFNWVIFALAIYAIPTTIAGLLLLIDAGAMADTVWSNADFQNWVISHDYDITVDSVKNYITIVAGLCLASGLCALVSMACVIRRKMWKIAVIACAAAAVLCCWSLFGIFIGLLMAWFVYSLKEMFSS